MSNITVEIEVSPATQVKPKAEVVVATHLRPKPLAFKSGLLRKGGISKSVKSLTDGNTNLQNLLQLSPALNRVDNLNLPHCVRTSAGITSAVIDICSKYDDAIDSKLYTFYMLTTFLGGGVELLDVKGAESVLSFKAQYGAMKAMGLHTKGISEEVKVLFESCFKQYLHEVAA